MDQVAAGKMMAPWVFLGGRFWLWAAAHLMLPSSFIYDEFELLKGCPWVSVMYFMKFSKIIKLSSFQYCL
jgi:hypothetical protein